MDLLQVYLFWGTREGKNKKKKKKKKRGGKEKDKEKDLFPSLLFFHFFSFFYFFLLSFPKKDRLVASPQNGIKIEEREMGFKFYVKMLKVLFIYSH